ncbi:MAG: bifunctional DNA-formamidopyrimidine glycosylase/DNA-(apurinic or apyrimidinic site) lyase [Pseudomonadota bacterium]
MPELPEVETVRRALAPALQGAIIARVTCRRPDLRFAFPAGFGQTLQGSVVERLTRRGKYLLATLDRDHTLIMHLGMSGRFRVEAQSGPLMQTAVYVHGVKTDPAHDHVVIGTHGPAGTAVITYNDPRRFGFMDLVATDDLETCRHFARMGPEPLSPAFTADTLIAACAGKNTPVKNALLDQRVVAGLGNIYVCEALFRAGISPKRKAGRISAPRLMRLHGEIVTVLKAAIKAGGSSLRDFASTDGQLGYFQHTFCIYDREGAACTRCRGTVRRVVQAGRSTFYCPACQR